MSTVDTLPSTLTAVASVVFILIMICVALISHRFGEDKPYPDDDVPHERDASHTPEQRRSE